MSIGLGIAIAGAWVPVAVAMAASEVTDRGAKFAYFMASAATALLLIFG